MGTQSRKVGGLMVSLRPATVLLEWFYLGLPLIGIKRYDVWCPTCNPWSIAHKRPLNLVIVYGKGIL